MFICNIFDCKLSDFMAIITEMMSIVC